VLNSGNYPTINSIKPYKNGIKTTNKNELERKMSEIKKELDDVIGDLEKQGIKPNSHLDPTITVGLGDVIESTLQTFGITEERFKEWFNLKECNCSKRKAWLNSIFSWKKNQA
jgi:hypothetical protein